MYAQWILAIIIIVKLELILCKAHGDLARNANSPTLRTFRRAYFCVGPLLSSDL